MATITSTAAGNWSAGGTWLGGVSPGDGDKAVVNHAVAVDVNTTLGTGVGETVLSGTGTVTFNTGTTFTLKGWIFDGALRFVSQAGSTFQFDSSANSYFAYFLSWSATGTSGSHAIIQSSGGTSYGFIFNSADATKCLLTWDYVDAVNLSDAGFHNQIGPSTITNSTFTGCDFLWVQAIGATADLVFNNVQFSASRGTSNIITALTASTTGLRTFSNLSLDKGALLAGNVANLILDSVQTNAEIVVGSANTTSGAFTRIKNVCGMIDPTATAAMLTVYAPGPISRCAFWLISDDHIIDPHTHNAGTYELSENVFHAGKDGAAGDAIVIYNDATAKPTSVVNAHNNLNLASPNGQYDITLLNHASGPIGLTISINHNTTAGEIAISQGGGNNADSTGKAMLTSCRSNIIRPGAGSSGHYLLEMYNPQREARTTLLGNGPDLWDKGTLSASDATSFTDATANWLTCFTDAPTNFYILFTSGAASGKATLITGNVSGIKGSVSAWTDAVTPGNDDYVIVVADVFTPANVGYNCHYNGLATGTIRRMDGTTTGSVQGYDGYYITSGTPGGNDQYGVNPQFLDSTRNIATYDIAGLANAAGTAWADTGATYNVGDIVSSATAGFYGNATINYRCITVHAPTGVANDKPGSGSAWTTYWEFATIHRMRLNPTLIDAMVTWIQAGYKVQTVALNNAGHDAATIGAMGYQASLTAGTVSLVGKTATTADLSSTDATFGAGSYTYQWYRSTSSGFTPGAGNILSGKTSLTLADTGLTANTAYYYRLKFTDADGTVVYATEFPVTTSSNARNRMRTLLRP